jgi:hypothetical protein
MNVYVSLDQYPVVEIILNVPVLYCSCEQFRSLPSAAFGLHLRFMASLSSFLFLLRIAVFMSWHLHRQTFKACMFLMKATRGAS